MSTEVSEQLLEAQIAEARERMIAGPAFTPFLTGDSEVDSSMSGGKAAFTSTAADRVIIYATDTGEPREILVNMLAKTLRKRRNGKQAFVVNPSQVPEFVQGNRLCMLHPDHPDIAMVRRLGITVTCGDGSDKPPAAHIASDFDVDLHMQHRHRREWTVIQRHLEEEEKRADRDRQNRIAEAMLASIGAKQAAPDNIHFCPADDCNRFFDSAQGLSVHKSRDHGGAA